MSAKGKKKDKTDRDKKSQNRSDSDKDKEDLEKAIRKLQKAERNLAKKKAQEDKELAEVLEQSRLEAERGARERELQALSSKPITPSTLLVLGNQKLFVSYKYGNVHVSSSAVPHDPLFVPFVLAKSCVLNLGALIVSQKRGKKNQALMRPHIPSPQFTFLNLTNDSKVPDELEPEGSKGPHASKSKDTVTDSAGLNSEHLPPSESKSDSETELPFKFPAKEGTFCEENSGHSPLYSSGRMNSSSCEEGSFEVKQEPSEGRGALNCDPNDELDLRNTALYQQGDISFSSSASDKKTAQKERFVITRKDVEVLRTHASSWETEDDALMAMRHLMSKDSRPNLVIDKKALASVLFHSHPPADFFGEIIKAQAGKFQSWKKGFRKQQEEWLGKSNSNVWFCTCHDRP